MNQIHQPNTDMQDNASASSSVQPLHQEKDSRSPIPNKRALSTYRTGGVVALVAIALILVAVKFSGVFNGSTASKDGTAAVFYNSDEVAARVNGEAITRADFEKRYAQVAIAVTAQKGPLDDTGKATLRNTVLTQMVDSLLIRQAATAEGLTVADDTVQKEYNDLVQSFEGERQLADQLSAVGMTKDELLKNIKDEKLVQAYMEKHSDPSATTVTEAEIKDFYEKQTAGTANPPKLADVHDAIKNQLVQQKTSAILQTYIAELRKTAKIEMLLKA